jgi:hypothetical protein
MGLLRKKWQQNWKEYCNKAGIPAVKEKNAWEERAIDKSTDLEIMAIMIIVTLQLAQKILSTRHSERSEESLCVECREKERFLVASLAPLRTGRSSE